MFGNLFENFDFSWILIIILLLFLLGGADECGNKPLLDLGCFDGFFDGGGIILIILLLLLFIDL